MSLMNKTLVNQIQGYAKKGVFYNQVGFIPGMKVSIQYTTLTVKGTAGAVMGKKALDKNSYS